MRRNLIPSTLGNLIGGSILVGTFYALSLGTPGHAIQVRGGGWGAWGGNCGL